MDRLKEKKIFREVLAALIASKLTASDLKRLSNLLTDSSSFNYDLARSLYDMSRSIEPQESMVWPEEVDLPSEAGDESLVALAHNVLQRRRMPKRILIDLIGKVSPKSMRIISEDMSSRKIISEFFSVATTRQAQEFLRQLGMDVDEDPYLGGISNRHKK